MTSSSKRKALRKADHSNGYALFQFKNSPDLSGWNIITDQSIGGTSWGLFEKTRSHEAYFCGSLCSINSAFVGVRSPRLSADFAQFSGFWLRVRGDLKQYRFVVCNHVTFNQPFFQTTLLLKDEDWHELFLPFNQFIWSMPNESSKSSDSLSPDAIHNVGFLIENNQRGAFGLEIDWIKLYTNASEVETVKD